MIKTKITLMAIIAGALLMLPLAACGSNNNNESGGNASGSPAANSPSGGRPAAGSAEASAPVNKDPVTLTFSTFNAWWTTGNIQAAIKLYEDKTGNKIEPQIYPDDQFLNIISTKLASGETPDVFAIYANVTLFNTDQLEPLDGTWTRRIDLETAQKNNYASMKDGKFYGAPYGASSYSGLMYNKEIFQKVGITPPLKTYQEFLDAADKIKALGVTPLTLPNKDGWTTQIVVNAGSHYLLNQDPKLGTDLASNQAKPADKPAIVDLFKRFLTLKDKGYTNKDDLSTTMAMAEQSLAEGKTAMVFGGDWLAADFDKNYSDKAADIGMTAVNWGDNAADLAASKGASGNALFIPKNSKHKQEAMDFVNFMMSEEAMQAMYDVLPGVNVLGYSTKASPWDREMQALVDTGFAQDGGGLTDAMANAFPGAGFDQGDFSSACRAIWNTGKIEAGLNDWYSEYAKLNKAKKINGF